MLASFVGLVPEAFFEIVDFSRLGLLKMDTKELSRNYFPTSPTRKRVDLKARRASEWIKSFSEDFLACASGLY